MSETFLHVFMGFVLGMYVATALCVMGTKHSLKHHLDQWEYIVWAWREKKRRDEPDGEGAG